MLCVMYPILDDRARTSTSAVETVVPIVKDVEEEEEALKYVSNGSRDVRLLVSPEGHLQSDETKGLDREQQVGVTVAPVGSGERNCNNPQVREDQVEQKNKAGRDDQEERQGEECRRQNRLLSIGVSYYSPTPYSGPHNLQ